MKEGKSNENGKLGFTQKCRIQITALLKSVDFQKFE